MLNRRKFLFSASSVVVGLSLPAISNAQSIAPSAAQIERSLSAPTAKKIRKEQRIERRELRKRRDLRIAAPSIDIQAINFAFGSARIPYDERWKVEEIAIAMRRILRRNRSEVFLIEGHTDAVGSRYNNQLLSEDRARSLKRVLARNFGIDRWALETVGYGEDYLLVPTQRPEWRNRRVTLRRVTDLIIR